MTPEEEELLKKILEDPFDMDQPNPEKERLTQLFLDSQKMIGLNMAVVMYMVDAMQHFQGRTLKEIKQTAVEIALQGAHGYDPGSETRYRVSAVPKSLSGYHILAYYYVSFAIVMPDLLPELNLPYDKEYQIAQTFFKKK